MMRKTIGRIFFWITFSLALLLLSVPFAELFAEGNSEVVLTGLVVAFILFSISMLLKKNYHPVFKTYHSHETTPLGFHKFVCFVLLPVRILFQPVTFVRTITSADFTVNPWYMLDLCTYVILFITAVICLTGLLRWRPYARHFLNAYMVTEVSYSAVVFLLYLYYSYMEFPTTQYGGLVGNALMCATISIYYHNRRLLFTSKSEADDIESAMDSYGEPERTYVVPGAGENFDADRAEQIDAVYAERPDTNAEQNTAYQNRNLNKRRAGIAVLVVMIVLLVGLNVFQLIHNRRVQLDQYEKIGELLYEMRDLEEEIQALKEDRDYWRNQNTLREEEIEFMEEFVVIVPDDGLNLYHKYGCEDLDLSYFWVYNVAAADQEYFPCAKCCQ